MSETAICRERLSVYCAGNGLDIGFGGDPVVPSAICLDRAEEDERRAHYGMQPTHLVAEADRLDMFSDGALDYVFSSHVLEDFENTERVLREWIRVLRPGGYLVLFLPDQKRYQADCQRKGSLPNQAHKLPHFSSRYISDCLREIGKTHTVLLEDPWDGSPYSFAIVAVKK